MKYLKFKNNLYLGLWGAGILTAWIIIAFGIASLLAYLFGESTKAFIIASIVFSSVIVGLWIIMGLYILLSGTVVITDSEIKLCRGKKVMWCYQKNDIETCRYNKFKWFYFLLPFGIENAFLLQFKLVGKGVSWKTCSLSLKQVTRIRDELGYPFKNLGD